MTDIVDPQALVRLEKLGGPELVRDMLQLFLDGAALKLQTLLAVEATQQLEEVNRAAHSLKSSAANVGALELSALAQRIELAAAGEADEPLAPLLSELEPLWLATQALLSRELQQRKENP